MTAIQDRIPHNHCYGCGPENPHGLQIKSHWDGKESVCVYEPRPEQCAGPEQYLYGGTIASLIDCHSIGTALAMCPPLVITDAEMATMLDAMAEALAE